MSDPCLVSGQRLYYMHLHKPETTRKRSVLPYDPSLTDVFFICMACRGGTTCVRQQSLNINRKTTTTRKYSQ
uniref:Uncharacterized protein n=1 Tax=Anguilla anguilla TaxID=7936 RepID=A0A0E9W8K0_ANGAN